MKIKEKYSNEFKAGDESTKTKEKLLKERGNLALFEIIKRENDLPYSEYGLYYKKENVMRIRIFIPDPRKKDSYKDIFLKYQNGVRQFMKDLFDVLIGEKDDIEQAYKMKQKKDLIWELKDDGIVQFYLKEDKDYLFGYVGFPSEKINVKIGENFVKYFEGIPIEEKWGEICEQ